MRSPEAFLFINPDGTIEGLHTEIIDLCELGTLHVERASTIEFDNEAQIWRAELKNGKKFLAKEREWCVLWERTEINRELERKCSHGMQPNNACSCHEQEDDE